MIERSRWRTPTLVDEGELTFVVVGGGPTGVETAGAGRAVLGGVPGGLPDHPRGAGPRDPGRGPGQSAGPVLAVEPAGRARYPAPGRSRCAWTRRSRRSRPTRSASPSGEVLPTRTVIWAAAAGHPLAEALGLTAGRPRRGGPGSGRNWPRRHLGHRRRGRAEPRGSAALLAPVAMVGWRGPPDRPAAGGQAHPAVPVPGQGHHGHDRPALGGGRAAGPDPSAGTVARFAWLGLHLLYLAGLRNRPSVLLNWLWGYLTRDRGPRIILGPDGRDRLRLARRPSARAAARDEHQAERQVSSMAHTLLSTRPVGKPTSARCSR